MHKGKIASDRNLKQCKPKQCKTQSVGGGDLRRSKLPEGLGKSGVDRGREGRRFDRFGTYVLQIDSSANLRRMKPLKQVTLS